MTDIASILGQASERMVYALVLRIEHPADGNDVAHVLLHPAQHGVADKMRRLAHIFGLRRADEDTTAPIDVPPDTAWATIDDADEGRSVWLHYGHEAWLHAPVDPAWETAATSRSYIIVSIGSDPLHTQRDIDRYMARSHRIYLGIVRLAPTD